MLTRFVALLRQSLGHPLVPVFVLIMAAVALTTFLVMLDAQHRLIEHEATQIAEVVARQALAARSVYTSAVADKLTRDGFGPDIASHQKRGHVPLPAQFLKLVGQEASIKSGGMFRYRPLSKWNLEPAQGLTDVFQRWAWIELERQDRPDPDGPIDWRAAWRIEEMNGVRTLRYMRADPAASRTCVDCHNSYEARADTAVVRISNGVAPGKQWKQHQLLGAIEVDIPVDRVEEIATAYARRTLALVVGISLIGLSIAAWYAFEDIRRKQVLAAEFERQARFDSLTGLANRLQFQERAREALLRAWRDGAKVGLLFVDLDRFKRINDSLGHELGDTVLRQVAQRLTESLREVDVVARHSGDEFTVLLHGNADSLDLASVARKLLETVGLPLQVDNHELFLSASVGISCFPRDGQDIETLVKNADIAMYRAKESGRNNFQFFSADMNTRALETLSISNRLRQAIERDQLLLYYQPRIDVHSSAITGVEAMLRWQHPELGMLEPLRFIQLAEDTGMIAAIGHWVLTAACRQMRRWDDAGVPPVRVAVNLSTRQFQASDLVEMVTTILQESGLEPTRLELEITESVLMQQPEAAEVVLRRLSDMGITLAIDDFGTGYSSLSYLKRFPIDYLKIDKSFIDGLPDDSNDRVITGAIMALARNLNVKAVAEGVETIDQYAFLAAHGCEEVQGYLMARPAPAEQIEPMLRAGRLIV
ncbi:MAG: EAL domain-containing protein [Gammaproteobacteria bacterium]|nr:EAL domain-containing protein [Gammaproteobacteria bacterium]